MTTATTARMRTDRDVPRGELAKLFEKLPPHSIESEMCLLGSMILAGTSNIHLIGEAMQIVKRGADFYLPKHGEIYDCVIELYDKNQSIDVVQLTERLRAKGQYEAIGEVDYLVELAESVPTPVNAPYYAQIVREKARLRALIDAAGRILRDAHESAEPANLVIDKAEQLIFEIASTGGEREASSLKDLIAQTFESLEARQESGRTLTGLATGFHQLDEMLGGMQNSEMLILAARPSMGKTALALNIAEYIAVDNSKPVAVFSLEMGRQQLAERLLSSRSGVDGQRMRRNQIGDHEMSQLQHAAAELRDGHIYIDDTPGLTALELRAKARRLANQYEIQAIVIDYLQLMAYPGSESRQNEVSAISRAIKALARELEVPVLCLSQLNRNPEGRESKKPMLSDLRESGAIEQDADVVMMLHREEYYHPDDNWRTENSDKVGVAELIIAKQRNGPTGTVALQFNHKTTRFNNLARGVSEPGF